MNNITDELAKLHELTGAEFSRQVERIALRNEFRPLEGETDIYVTGGETSNDFENQLNAARKAVMPAVWQRICLPILQQIPMLLK